MVPVVLSMIVVIVLFVTVPIGIAVNVAQEIWSWF